MFVPVLLIAFLFQQGPFTCTYNAPAQAAVCKLNHKTFTIPIDWRDPYFDEWTWQAFRVEDPRDHNNAQWNYNRAPEQILPKNGAILPARFDSEGVFRPIARCGVDAVRDLRTWVSQHDGTPAPSHLYHSPSECDKN